MYIALGVWFSQVTRTISFQSLFFSISKDSMKFSTVLSAFSSKMSTSALHSKREPCKNSISAWKSWRKTWKQITVIFFEVISHILSFTHSNLCTELGCFYYLSQVIPKTSYVSKDCQWICRFEQEGIMINFKTKRNAERRIRARYLRAIWSTIIPYYYSHHSFTVVLLKNKVYLYVYLLSILLSNFRFMQKPWSVRAT